MKKEVATHFIFLAALFLLVTILKGWFDVRFIIFWLGGIIGTILPDIDHLIYVYFVKPDAADSQRAVNLIQGRSFFKGWKYLTETRTTRTDLIFHTAHFQILFVLFAIVVITSSGSLLGAGLVLAFLLHLLVDQAIDFFEGGNFSAWFSKLPIELDEEQRKWYLGVNLVVLLVIILLM